MEDLMKGIMLMIKSMDKEYLFGGMAGDMKASGNEESSTVKGHIHFHPEKKKLAFGLKEKGHVGLKMMNKLKIYKNELKKF